MLYRLSIYTIKITTLYFILWSSYLYSQDKSEYIELSTLKTPSLKSDNPSFLQDLNDTILFNTQTFLNYSKGEFVNYFETNENLQTGIVSSSYNRLSNKTVVYGYASYMFSKGKNCNGSTFLYPYRVPFNFTPREEKTKGDRRLESYKLISGLSHMLTPKLTIGSKFNYNTVSFVKLKDMRNINDILDFTLNNGLSYKLNNFNSIGIAYLYNRFIESLGINEYGNLEKDYYALINRGNFSGEFILYGDDGILDTRFFNKNWVDISHKFGLQYQSCFSEKIKLFTAFGYKKAKGYFGNDSDNSVIYMRHHKNNYNFKTSLNVLCPKSEHIISCEFENNKIKNKEQLYKKSHSSIRNFVIEYFGERQISVKKKQFFNFNYLHTFQVKDPWIFSCNYTYNRILRQSNNYPFYRIQILKWSTIGFRISKTFRYKNILIYFKQNQYYRKGKGGYPIDEKLVENTGNTKPPHNLDNLLHKEREYLTAKRATACSTFRISRNLDKKNIYLELKQKYTFIANTSYSKENNLDLTLSLGVAF